MNAHSITASKDVDRRTSFKGVSRMLSAVSLLAAYRWSFVNMSPHTWGWRALLTWLLVTALFYSGATSPDDRRFCAVHHFARCAAGASILIAAATPLLRTGEISLLVASAALAPVFGFYVASCLATMTTKSGSIELNQWRGTLAHSMDVWLPVGLGAVILRDIRIISFAVWTPKSAGRQAGEHSAVFSNHFVARPMMIALLAIALVELAVGHILLRSLSPWIVNIHLAFGLLFVLYVVGIIRSFGRLPTIVQGDALTMRMSVLFEAHAAISSVRAISRISAMPAKADEHVANGAILVAPNILVEFATPLRVDRIFKTNEYARFIAIYVDNPDGFIDFFNAFGNHDARNGSAA